MRRFLLLVLVAVTALTAATSADARPAPTDTPVLKHFQQRVCHLFKAMDRKAAPSVVTFNDQYFNAEPTPENLLVAGKAAQRSYAIYANYNKPLFALRAPAGDAGLWSRYKQQEREVLRLGFLGADALETGELSRFERIKTKNESDQATRNATWDQIGIVCE
jgi:hypothetical protein